ncbi:MAG: hypothetical protein LUG60_13095 [Erysipelotrichaceae bacterium]|nr:hypothetical protein [Erysipelotrichaceae bacterium]
MDIRHIDNFDERTFFAYDKVVFCFFVALNSIPSTTLEIFQKLESSSKTAHIYALAICDEFECEKCDTSLKIIKNWCLHENLEYKGDMRIGSCLTIMKTNNRFIVCNQIKKFAHAIINDQDTHLSITLPNEKSFFKNANKYWSKEIKKKHKQRRKQRNFF